MVSKRQLKSQFKFVFFIAGIVFLFLLVGCDFYPRIYLNNYKKKETVLIIEYTIPDTSLFKATYTDTLIKEINSRSYKNIKKELNVNKLSNNKGRISIPSKSTALLNRKMNYKPIKMIYRIKDNEIRDTLFVNDSEYYKQENLFHDGVLQRKGFSSYIISIKQSL